MASIVMKIKPTFYRIVRTVLWNLAPAYLPGLCLPGCSAGNPGNIKPPWESLNKACFSSSSIRDSDMPPPSSPPWLLFIVSTSVPAAPPLGNPLQARLRGLSLLSHEASSHYPSYNLARLLHNQARTTCQTLFWHMSWLIESSRPSSV